LQLQLQLQLLQLPSSGLGQSPLQEADLAEAEQQLAALSNQLGEPDEQLELLFATCDKLRMALQECSNISSAGGSSSSSLGSNAAGAAAQQCLGQFVTDYRRVHTWVQRVNGGLSSKEAAVKALRSLVQHVLQQQGPSANNSASAAAGPAAAAAVSGGAAAVSASAPTGQS
jgi:hypothetical protein